MNRAAGRLRVLQGRLVDEAVARSVDNATLTAVDAFGSRARQNLAGWLLAAPVHLLTVGGVVAGCWLVLRSGFLPAQLFGGLLLLGAFVTRPRLPRRPDHLGRFTPADAPALFELLGRIADTTGAPTPDEVVVSLRFNASVSRAGLRGQVLELGAPLWAAAPAQARVALIGHELGHLARPDLIGGLWVGSAVRTLEVWLDAVSVRSPDAGVLGLGGELVQLPLRLLIGAYLGVLHRVNASAHRRQEIFADLSAIRAGGSSGAVSLFETTMAEKAVMVSLRRACRDPERPDMWQAVGTDLAASTDTDRARRRALAAREKTRLDDSHPATVLRMALVERRGHEEGTVRLDPALLERTDRELAEVMELAGSEVRDLLGFAR